MANIKLQRGNLSNIQNTSPKNGTLSIAKDTKQILLDDNNNRIIVGEANYIKGVTYPAVVDSNGALSINNATTANDGLMSKEDKTKLNGIDKDANNYTHPTNHPASIIIQDANNRFVTDAEKTTWNGKAEASHGTHVSYSSTTPVMDGIASAGSASTVARSDHKHPTDTSRAAASHTHSKSQITDFPSSMPASDVFAWAKAASKPSYSWNEITNKPSTFTPSGHTHSVSEITGILPTSKGGTGNTSGLAASATKLANSRTISLTGDITGSTSFDGTANAGISTSLVNSGVSAGEYGPLHRVTSNYSVWVSNNVGIHSTSATSTWTAKQACKLSFSWKVSSESTSYDYLTITAAGSTILDKSGGTAIQTGNLTATLSANQSIVFTYKKDSSANKGIDRAEIYNVKYGAGTASPSTVLDESNTEQYFTISNGMFGFYPGIPISSHTVDSKGRITKDEIVHVSPIWVQRADKATSSTKLDTARTIRTNLGSSNSVSFDGTANVTPGVSGTLGIANGGTGASDATSARNNLGVASSNHTHSNYAFKASPVFTGSISLGRKSGTTVGSGSFAVGENLEASENQSHAEGSHNVSSGSCSHAEGNGTKATGHQSHAEGSSTTASGQRSHAEGDNTTASGYASHAEGYYTTASNYASHACGKYSKAMTDGETGGSTIGDVFVIGNGRNGSSRSNCFRATYSGQVYGLSNFNSSGADYAEYFEWADSNINDEDRVGYFVTLEGKKIKIANPGDYILGIVSGQPCIIGNADEDWLGRWEHDEYGRFILEYLEEKKEEISTEGMTEDEINVLHLDSNVQKEDNKLYRIISKVVDYPTKSWRYKANPKYDSTQQYIERKDRKEWSAVGMVGVLSVRDDGSCKVNGYCKVSDNGIATVLDDEFSIVNGKVIKSYHVIERVSNNVIKVVFR